MDFFHRIWSKSELAGKSQSSLPMLQLKVRHIKANVALTPTVTFALILYNVFIYYFSITFAEIAASLSIFCRIKLCIQKCT